MPGALYPKFRKNNSGELLLSDSAEGRLAAGNRPKWSPPFTAAVVDKEARERVAARQGDLTDEKDVLGRSLIRFILVISCTIFESTCMGLTFC